MRIPLRDTYQLRKNQDILRADYHLNPQTNIFFRWSNDAQHEEIGLGIWSLFVPAITKAGFHTLAWILVGFLVISALLGLFFAPSNAGKTLEELHPEDRRAVTYTMHPEAIGRGYLVRMLDSVITAMAGRGRPWFATHAQIADLAGAPPIESP